MHQNQSERQSGGAPTGTTAPREPIVTAKSQAGNTVRVIDPSGNLVSYGTLRIMHHNGMM